MSDDYRQGFKDGYDAGFDKGFALGREAGAAETKAHPYPWPTTAPKCAACGHIMLHTFDRGYVCVNVGCANNALAHVTCGGVE